MISARVGGFLIKRLNLSLFSLNLYLLSESLVNCGYCKDLSVIRRYQISGLASLSIVVDDVYCLNLFPLSNS